MAYLEEARRPNAAEPVSLTEDQKAKRCFVPEQWLALLLLLGIAVGWEIGVALRWVDALFFPAPSTIMGALVETLRDGSLWINLIATLVRLGAGVLLGGSAGLGVGLLMGWSRRLGAVLDPFVAALYPLPKIALLPLAMILFGIGESSKIALIAVSAFFPMLLNTLAGIQQIPPIYWEVAENYGARHWQFLTRILFPGSFLQILTGLRIALNTALIITLSVELLTTQIGLGSMIWLAWQTMRLQQLYATLVVIALLGYGFNLLLTYLATYLAPWQHQQAR
jgi:NitT/TauT family transport system permease protein